MSSIHFSTSPSLRSTGMMASSGVGEATPVAREPPQRFSFVPTSLLAKAPSTKVGGSTQYYEDVLLQDPSNAKPSGAELYGALMEDPVHSKILTMGLINIKTDLESLIDRRSTLSDDIQKETEYTSELTARLVYEERARDVAFKEYVEASTKYNQLAQKATATDAEIKKRNAMLAFSHELKEVTDVFVDTLHIIMKAHEDGTAGKLSDGDIDTICSLLHASTYEEIFKKTTAQCLGILHVLDVCRYAQHPFFIGLWQIPLNGMTRDAWRIKYGITPRINTGKSGALINDLRQRVADYLGRVPSTDPPADNVESDTKIVHELLASDENSLKESLTTEDLKKRQTNASTLTTEELLEELKKRQATTSTGIGDDDDDAATGATAATADDH